MTKRNSRMHEKQSQLQKATTLGFQQTNVGGKIQKQRKHETGGHK